MREQPKNNESHTAQNTAHKNIAFHLQTTYNVNIFPKGVKMSGTTTNVNIRMNTELKKQAETLFGELGMNLTTAFNIFVRQSLRQGGIPFTVSLNEPNKETIDAMLEAKRISKDENVKGYRDLEALFKDLNA
jgi:DNA-damage-inducible protein J